jgi:aryl-alcohol dehydrogenase-like predicted oxidoreductase
METKGSLPKRVLGKTKTEVTILGLGGEGILRTFEREKEAVPFIHRAIDLGIILIRTSLVGSESYYESLRERRGRLPSQQNPGAHCDGASISK